VSGRDLSERVRAEPSGRRSDRELLGCAGPPDPVPGVLKRIGKRFREAVRRFAESNCIPVVRFKKGGRKIDVIRRHLGVRSARNVPPGQPVIPPAPEPAPNAATSK
jgi:hypothetical protein